MSIGLEPFANARNAAAGALKLLDSEEAAKRGLDLICYSVVSKKGSLKSQFQVHQFLRATRLPHFDKEHINLANDSDEIMTIADRIESIRSSLPFEIDGIVIKVDDLELQQNLGHTAKTPKHSLAHKFVPESAETRVKDIVVQVGKSGTLTPVAIFDPTELAGSIIQRATLHNQEEIDRLDVRIGDYVVIKKGGDVIPKVTEVILSKRKENKKWQMEPNCPCCGSEVVKRENEVAIRCINRNCKEQIARKIIFFVSKRALDIEGLGEALIRHLIDEGIISNIADIYKIAKDDLLALDGICLLYTS
ncbi:MAG: NAD-dependent DNA ligase LigA, partial [Alphaproteobacteria bacterium]|nr:NAD-dependent DNA ligase LigA [Alphaproteobacteria bacterium]